MRQFNTLTGFLLSKSDSPAINDTVEFQGYDEVGDGGGATWKHNGTKGQTPSQSPAQLGIPLLNDGNGNQWGLVFDDYINIESLGALKLTDSTLAIKAAIAGASAQSSALVGDDNRIIYSPIVVGIPGGAFLFSDTLTVNKNFVKILGLGSGSSVLYRTDGTFGDSVVFSPVDPSVTRLIGSSISGVKIDARTDMTSGSHLSLVSVSQADFEDLFLENGFKSYHLKGVQNCNFRSTFALVGRYYPTSRVGTKYLHIEAGDFENTEVFFTTFNYAFTINPTVEVGIEINEMDGVWFGDGHVLGAETELLIDGTGSGQLIAGRFSNVWFDGFTDTNIIFKGTATGSFKDFAFNGCKTSGASSLCVHVESGCNVSNVKLNGHDFENCNASGVLLEGGDDFTFAGGFRDIARAGTANQYFIKVEVGSGVTNLVVDTEIMNASTIDYGIRVLEPLCSANIGNIDFAGVQIEEIDIPSVGFLGKIGKCSTSRVNFNDVAVGALIQAPTIAEVVNITGTTGRIETIQNVWDGRTIMLRGDSASHAIDHGLGNILTNDNVNITLNANRGRSLTYSGDAGAWYDA